MYVKAAQHIVSMSHAVPREFGEVLAVLQDRVAPLPLDAVREVIRDELGQDLGACSGRSLPSLVSLPPSASRLTSLSLPLLHAPPADSLFASFSPKPIAAASLAQVHRAVTHDGQTVAVKVQYSYLRDITGMDIATVRALTALCEWAFPRFKLAWLADQFELHMRQELDFVHEGQSGERIRALLSGRPDVYVPRVRWDLTSTRVIVTEFIDGAFLLLSPPPLTCLHAWTAQ